MLLLPLTSVPVGRVRGEPRLVHAWFAAPGSRLDSGGAGRRSRIGITRSVPLPSSAPL